MVAEWKGTNERTENNDRAGRGGAGWRGKMEQGVGKIQQEDGCRVD